ncbi:MAG: MBOAT family protein, partial [Gammaproteobacteria bacterium]|nr:MBOAT family protein [Gammaproteobacteria bacterium]
MLFHTPEFLLGFLPLTLCGYFLLGSWSWQFARVWLAVASLVFYGWWNPYYVVLILGSIAGNFGGGKVMERLARNRQRVRLRAMLMLLVLCNLSLLVYFKYLMFFADEVNHLVGTHWDVGQIVLPIGISFYTFTQIAYLADLYQGKVREGSMLNYLLFVTYFPHLVAGPVLHHAEMMPQFADERNLRFAPLNFARGITFLAFGLCKKIVLADGCAPLADRAFAAGGTALSTGDAWLGAVAYSLQIYYDFSGYCDMAIGLSLLFNIRLPVNFHSPYRSVNIIEFWRRWHITLSRFLRDYLYIPLGGNRRGDVRRYINLLVTMLLGGVWHGANWTFLIWGGLHGTYLCLNHLWRHLASGWRPAGRFATPLAT